MRGTLLGAGALLALCVAAPAFAQAPAPQPGPAPTQPPPPSVTPPPGVGPGSPPAAQAPGPEAEHRGPSALHPWAMMHEEHHHEDHTPKGAFFRFRRGDADITIRCADSESTRVCVEAALILLDKVRSEPAGAQPGR